MIGSFLTRGLVMVFGYAYPAYECYKTVEMNKPDIAVLRFWCQYWILVAMLTVCERVGDTFISWVPMYSEAKLAFFIYLWCPKTKGTTYVYESFFRPLVAEHENEIDRSLSELRTQASDLVVLYGQKAISYGQTRVFDVLHYIASQSNPAQPAVKKKQDQGVTNRKETSKPVTAAEKPVSLPRTSSNQKKKDDDVSEENASQKHAATLSSAALNTREVAPAPAPAPAPIESSKSSSSNEAQAMEIDDSVVTKENAEPNLQETVVAGTGRVTRARSKKTHTPAK